MKNFQKLAERMNVAPLLNAVMRDKSLWNANTLRTTHPDSPHQQVEDIWLRFNKLPTNEDVAYEEDMARNGMLRVVDDCEAINYPAWSALPEAQEFVLNLMRMVRGERIGRVLITSLSPGKAITPHKDLGAPAEYYDRYHVVLQGLPGSMFKCGDEAVQMLTGEAWWFDNCETHECINNSADDRIHMVVDIRTCR